MKKRYINYTEQPKIYVLFQEYKHVDDFWQQLRPLGSNYLLLSPAVEKTRSLGTEVAGMERYALASGDSKGYLERFSLVIAVALALDGGGDAKALELFALLMFSSHVWLVLVESCGGSVCVFA